MEAEASTGLSGKIPEEVACLSTHALRVFKVATAERNKNEGWGFKRE